jgi:hypothetical protein
MAGHKIDKIMTKRTMTGIMVNGRMATAGVTFYVREGKTVVRTSHSNQPKRRTRAQFDVRMRTKHTALLWRALQPAGPLFYGSRTTFTAFASLANRLPVVYLPAEGQLEHAQLLLPKMPVSFGTIPTVRQHLGTVDGTAALITSLRVDSLKRGEKLRLYTLRQTVEGGTPLLHATSRDVTIGEMRPAEGGLALVDELFADPMCGWALVHVADGNCSSQTAVSRCTLYEQYTTEEALQAAAASYGGLTE